jgi:hypothetical protein
MILTMFRLSGSEGARRLASTGKSGGFTTGLTISVHCKRRADYAVDLIR